MKNIIKILLAGITVVTVGNFTARAQQLTPVPIKQVTINDKFWSPKLNTLRTVTVYDVLDKLEGKYVPENGWRTARFYLR